MESLINAIGGYDSWQFAVLFLGTTLLGMFLYALTRWLIFIPIFGVIVTWFYFNHLVGVNTPKDNFIAGVSSTIPVLVCCIQILIMAIVWNWRKTLTTHSEQKEDES